MRRYLIFVAAATMAFFVSVGSASALVVGFERITANGSADAASQLSVEATDSGSGSALFDFTVSAGANSLANVAEIYFDDDAGLFVSPLTINSQTGASFTAGSASPPDLPGGNAVGFSRTPGLVADSGSGSVNGLTIGDMLILELTYLNGVDFSDVMAALIGDTLRIGLHVRSLVDGSSPDGASDSFVSTATVSAVPLPATLPLLLGALAGFGFFSRRYRDA